MNSRDPHAPIPDVQSTADTRNLAINRVGIRGVRYPIHIVAPDSTVQPTVATFALSVALPPEKKGTHMSRFLELMEAHKEPLGASTLPEMLDEMLMRLNADAGMIELHFTAFMRKAAPVSGITSMMDYDVTLTVEKDANSATRVTTQIVVPVTSLCPCSKEISAYGAHNQRSHLTIGIRTIIGKAVKTIEAHEIIRIAETQASSELYGILKRPDEKFVTERAYDNPKFVEDLVRDVAHALDDHAGVSAFRVEAENFESIHNHSAYAVIEHGGW
jgi:GTP cyclohydrolase IB